MVDWLHRNDHNIHKAAREFNIDRKRVREWDQKYNELQRMNVGANAKRRKLNTGRTPLSPELDQRLFEFLEQERSEGRPVSNACLQAKAAKLVPVYVSLHSNQVLDGYGGGRGEMVWECGAVRTVLRKFQLTMLTSFITSESQ